MGGLPMSESLPNNGPRDGIYQTPNEIKEFKQRYPNYKIRDDVTAIQVTSFPDGTKHVEVLFPNG